MPLYPAILSANMAAHSWFTQVELFHKFPSYPDVDQILADVDGGNTFYLHVFLTHGGVLAAEASYHGGYCRVNLTPHLHLTPGRWYWISVAVGATDMSVSGAPNSTSCYGLVGQAFDYGGTTDGPQGVFAGPGSYSEIVNCKVAWGVSLNAAFGHQKNEPGRLIAQPRIGIGNSAVDGAVSGTAPTADPTAIDGLYYPAREAVGDIAVLHDGAPVGASGFDMDSGPLGCTIVRDSPY